MDTTRTKWTESYWKMFFVYFCVYRYIQFSSEWESQTCNVIYIMTGTTLQLCFFFLLCLFSSFGWVEFEWIRAMDAQSENINKAGEKNKIAFDHHTSYTPYKCNGIWLKKNKTLFYCFDSIVVKYELWLCERHQKENYGKFGCRGRSQSEFNDLQSRLLLFPYCWRTIISHLKYIIGISSSRANWVELSLKTDIGNSEQLKKAIKKVNVL